MNHIDQSLKNNTEPVMNNMKNPSSDAASPVDSGFSEPGSTENKNVSNRANSTINNGHWWVDAAFAVFNVSVGLWLSSVLPEEGLRLSQRYMLYISSITMAILILISRKLRSAGSA